MRISYTSYNFREPVLISEEEYNRHKYNFSINNTYYPFPTDGVRDEFSTLFKFLYGAIAAIAIGALIKPLEWLAGIGIFILFAMLMGPLHSVSSYSSYLSKRNKYYKSLKKCIVSSKDYSDFITMFKRR